MCLVIVLKKTFRTIVGWQFILLFEVKIAGNLFLDYVIEIYKYLDISNKFYS